MKHLRIFAVLLATLTGCPEDRGFPTSTSTQFVTPEGDRIEPSFSTLAVAFAFTLTDLDGLDRVFVQNPATGASEEASTAAPDPDGFDVVADDDSFGGTTDASGRLVAFLSAASNLLPGRSTSGTVQAYLRDLDTNQITLVSENAAGDEADAPVTSVQISGNGRFLTFATAATNLVQGADNGFSQIFVFDLFLGVLQLISIDTLGVQGDGDSTDGKITPDGRFVVFGSGASNFVMGDVNTIDDIYLYDRSARTMERVTGAAGGTRPIFSHNANFVVFERMAGGFRQMFCRDRAAMVTALISFNAGALPGDGDSTSPSITGDGRFTVYQSDATDLVAGDTNGFTDIFVFDAMTATITRINLGPMGLEADAPSRGPSIMADGRKIAFESLAFNITNLEPRGLFEIFLFDNPLLP